MANQLIIIGFHLEELQAQQFLPEGGQRENTGWSPAWEVFARPVLTMDLGCPDCGLSFTAEYYGESPDQSGRLRCPACGHGSGPDRLQAATIFGEQLRAALREAGPADEAAMAALGRLIANAAILLEPLTMIFVVGFRRDRIGHYVSNTRMFLVHMKKALGYEPMVIAFPPESSPMSPVANQYLTTLWSRRLLVTPAALPAYRLLRTLKGHHHHNPAINLLKAWGLVPRADKREVCFTFDQPRPRQARHLVDLNDDFWANDNLDANLEIEPIFRFTPEEERTGRSWLAEHSVPERYVTFLGRDAVYLERHQPGHDFSYHNYRDMDIKTFIPAMNWLAEQGLGALRMGSAVKERLTADRPGVVDYASSGRTELLDIYFLANGFFHVSCSSGPDQIPHSRHRPILNVNTAQPTPLALNTNSAHIHFAFKETWSRREGRFLSLREQISRGYGLFIFTEQFENNGLELVDNSAEDILEMVREMYRRTTGQWVETEDEKILRDKMARLLAEFYPGYELKCTPVYSFFKAHPYLLADA